MFCPKCGKERPDDKQFCRECGSPLFKRVPTDTQNTQKKTVSSPDAGMIIIGILIILGMYLVPIVPSSSFWGNSMTLAKTWEYCTSPIPVIHCNLAHTWFFYFGWIIGVVLIVMGIYNKKTVR
jgi:hypothetical protein